MLWRDHVYFYQNQSARPPHSVIFHFSYLLHLEGCHRGEVCSAVLQEGFSGPQRKKSSFSIEQSSNHVFELCLRPLPPLSNFQLPVLLRAEGSDAAHLYSISADINVFSLDSVSALNCLLKNVTKLKFSTIC